MVKNKFVCHFWKFVNHAGVASEDFAKAVARRIESGEFVPPNHGGVRYYKSMGWCFDVGRKPYLINYAYGHIERNWASSVRELRHVLALRRADRVVLDPFAESETD